MTFIDAWMNAYDNGGNQSDVARDLGCSSANVSTRAKKLRESGVELPELTVSRGVKLDVASLNARLTERLNQG
jgi:DNA-binding Lrp family transcriptional regulator